MRADKPCIKLLLMKCVPAALIVGQMEVKSCQLNLEQRWVFLLMLSVGVSPAKLLEIYDRLYKSKVSFCFVFSFLLFKFGSANS